MQTGRTPALIPPQTVLPYPPFHDSVPQPLHLLYNSLSSTIVPPFIPNPCSHSDLLSASFEAASFVERRLQPSLCRLYSSTPSEQSPCSSRSSCGLRLCLVLVLSVPFVGSVKLQEHIQIWTLHQAHQELGVSSSLRSNPRTFCTIIPRFEHSIGHHGWVLDCSANP
jgi:hypothetical protein